MLEANKHIKSNGYNHVLTIVLVSYWLSFNCVVHRYVFELNF